MNTITLNKSDQTTNKQGPCLNQEIFSGQKYDSMTQHVSQTGLSMKEIENHYAEVDTDETDSVG